MSSATSAPPPSPWPIGKLPSELLQQIFEELCFIIEPADGSTIPVVTALCNARLVCKAFRAQAERMFVDYTLNRKYHDVGSRRALDRLEGITDDSEICDKVKSLKFMCFVRPIGFPGAVKLTLVERIRRHWFAVSDCRFFLHNMTAYQYLAEIKNVLRHRRRNFQRGNLIAGVMNTSNYLSKAGYRDLLKGFREEGREYLAAFHGHSLTSTGPQPGHNHLPIEFLLNHGRYKRQFRELSKKNLLDRAVPLTDADRENMALAVISSIEIIFQALYTDDSIKLEEVQIPVPESENGKFMCAFNADSIPHVLQHVKILRLPTFVTTEAIGLAFHPTDFIYICKSLFPSLHTLELDIGLETLWYNPPGQDISTIPPVLTSLKVHNFRSKLHGKDVVAIYRLLDTLQHLAFLKADIEVSSYLLTIVTILKQFGTLKTFELILSSHEKGSRFFKLPCWHCVKTSCTFLAGVLDLDEADAPKTTISCAGAVVIKPKKYQSFLDDCLGRVYWDTRARQIGVLAVENSWSLCEDNGTCSVVMRPSSIREIDNTW
ncbi:hypothetical protein B0J11DRAFT_503127 [Dendryphion nanum]|uniref:F-box domain-containing protein n=1 Tax=Dendryphion nanum TaxID=256645 RepID=A0A9P9E5U9_9PLEO|nr:hypothetical protein B0J11DRAFT_503127 [Dendryphion nanum]